MTLRKTLAQIAPAALMALILLFFARLTFTNLIFGRGDAYAYFYPYWHSTAQALQAGRLPLWNDLLFAGTPFMANIQVGLFYPPNWPLWLLLPDAPTAIKASVLLHILWAGIGAYLLARRVLALSPLAAFTGGALFAVGGQLTAHTEQVNQLQGLSWLPWLFLLLHLARGKPWRWGPLLTLAFGAQILSGHTQTVFISGVGLGIAALWWGIRTGEKPLPRRFGALITLAVAAIMALLITLPQLAPTLELSSLSNRSGGLTFNEVIAFSLHPALVGRALLPGHDIALHNEYIGTIGAAGLTLALIGGWYGWRQGKTSQAWIIVAGFGLIAALGGWTPLYWLLGRLPGFDLFRVPARWLILWALGGSMLAAFAVHHAQTHKERPPRLLTAAILGVILVLVAGAFLSPLVDDVSIQGTITPTIDALAGWGIAALLIALALLALQPRHAAPLLAALAIVELLIASQHMPYNRLTAPEVFADPRPPITILGSHQADLTPPPRYLTISQLGFAAADQPLITAQYYGEMPGNVLYDLLIDSKLKTVIAPNLGMIWNLPTADGFDGGVLPIANYTTFSRLLLDDPPPDGRLRENLTGIPDQRWLDLLGVGYLITDRAAGAPSPDWQPLHMGDVSVYAHSAAPPRAVLIPQAVVIADDEEALAQMQAADFSPWERVILADGEPLSGGEGFDGQAVIMHYAPESVTLTTRSSDDAYLLLTDAHYPGWQAAIDGTAAAIHRADVLFRAVYVPAGEHTVTFTYTPTSWPGALLVGGAALIGLLAVLIAAWWRAVRPAPPPAGKN